MVLTLVRRTNDRLGHCVVVVATAAAAASSTLLPINGQAGRQAGRANCHKFLLIQAQILNLLLLPTAAAAAVAVADHVAEIIIDVRRRRRKEERIGATRRIGKKESERRKGSICL